jgi:hypothetical protein
MTSPIATSAPSPVAATPVAGTRWNGHMADDVGATYGQEPLAFLNATADELLLSGNRGTFRFPRAAIVKIARGRMYPWLFSAVRFQHTVPGFPVDLQFKPLDATPRQVLDGLRSLGYPVR